MLLKGVIAAIVFCVLSACSVLSVMTPSRLYWLLTCMQCCDDDDGVERPAETAKEKAAREAREKKEKAQELIRKREAEEAAQNLGILLGTSQCYVDVAFCSSWSSMVCRSVCVSVTIVKYVLVASLLLTYVTEACTFTFILQSLWTMLRNLALLISCAINLCHSLKLHPCFSWVFLKKKSL